MRIVADENIPAVRELFGHLGDVECFPGRQITAALCQHADILLVRSVTKVDAGLLAGSPVRFVGSATIGIDHIDTDFLAAHDIQWASAPGSNADSVVDYVFSAFCRLDGALGHLLGGATVGIVGMGNVGSRLYRRLDAMGIKCVAYDPLLNQGDFPVLCDLNTVLQSDFICVHAPLTQGGSWPSFHLLDESTLASIKPGTTLLNAGRGGVIDNAALLELLKKRHDISVVLDVWENEPSIDVELMKRVDLATPHIAGYSVDGKLAGSKMIYTACCDAMNREASAVESGNEGRIPLALRQKNAMQNVIREAVLSVYDVASDDQHFRGAMLHGDGDDRGERFDQLRRNYPERREFSRYQISDAAQLCEQSRRCLSALGFHLSP